MRSFWLLLLALLVLSDAGCSRTRYRVAADRDAYCIVQEKSAQITEPVAINYTVRPDPRSRFYDPTNPDCPQLPSPHPVLNSYELPLLASDSGNCQPNCGCMVDANVLVGTQDLKPNASFSSNTLPNAVSHALAGTTNLSKTAAIPVVPASFTYNSQIDEASQLKLVEPVPATPTDLQAPNLNGNVPLKQVPTSDEAPQITQETTPSNDNKDDSSDKSSSNNGGSANSNSFYRPIPQQAWQSIPESCLSRMLEFSSIRTEYAQSFPEADLSNLNSGEKRLTLANLMELANINSREYQVAKESLFRASLALTAERYQYDLNPLQFGNGTATNYRHTRNNGATVNSLAIPSGVGVQKQLASAGQFLATFANSVVLTFNGPSGFATDVSSNLVFDFQQTVFQRDVQFEQLTRNEREVVYAMRDYLRFRKQLFRDVSGLYYNLLLNYRSIEISTSDYFTTLRGFLQSQSEYRTAEKIPRVQVDQFEQNVLRTRGTLVGNCYALETAMDQFKFRLGLPTEMPILLDLTELESISLRDELSVARQMINRVRGELMIAKASTNADATTLANVAEVLADRMANILKIQRRIEESVESREGDNVNTNQQGQSALDQATKNLQQLQRRLQILGVRMQVESLKAELDAQMKSDVAAPPLLVMNRAIEYCTTQLQVIDLALDNLDGSPAPVDLKSSRDKLAKELDGLLNFLLEISSQLRSSKDLIQSTMLAEIPVRSKRSMELVLAFESLADSATEDLLPRDGQSVTATVESTVDKTIELSDKLLQSGPDGWEEIVLDHNETLLTGLVQRLDLMNQRGRLADAWRQIKLAGDDLKSIVNLRATQIIGTRTGSDNPVDFSFDNSETRLSAALDTPLNRRIQRNTFRLALINYNVGLRNLMAAEDAIKLDLREDLRQLALDRTQYTISVASAALAYERVISTRLRLQLAVQGVAARDFLEAQQAYTNALNSIARQHVNYITDRIELFFDLEGFQVDSCGNWEGATSDAGPELNVDFPGRNPKPYGTLPPKVRYSPTVRQIEKVAPGSVEVRP